MRRGASPPAAIGRQPQHSTHVKSRAGGLVGRKSATVISAETRLGDATQKFGGHEKSARVEGERELPYLVGQTNGKVNRLVNNGNAITPALHQLDIRISTYLHIQRLVRDICKRDFGTATPLLLLLPLHLLLLVC